MKFQITIKEQSEAINGKAKYPLYKSFSDKNYDQDRGLEALEELIESSSIKIYCDECQKEITSETIMIAYEGQLKVSAQKGNQQMENPKQTKQENNPIDHNLKDQKNTIQKKLEYLQIGKLSLSNQNDQESSSEENQPAFYIQNDSFQEQNQNDPIKQIPIKKVYDQTQQKQNDQTKEETSKVTEITHLYCVGCFACLQQFPKFYSIRKSFNFSPLNSSWAVLDEINLLNGLKMWGFGNWGQIKQFMDYNGSLFSLRQIEQHYEALYLNGNGPILPTEDKFNMSTVNKPAKKSLQKIMHEYYFPADRSQHMPIFIQNVMEKEDKPQKAVFGASEQRKISLIGMPSSGDRQMTFAYCAKHLQGHNNFTADARHASNTSLLNLNQQKQQNDQEKSSFHQNIDKQDQNQEQSEQSQFQEAQNQIQLKPKSSIKMPESKMSGKGIKQGHCRSVHLFLEDQNKPVQNSIMPSFMSRSFNLSNSQTKLKGQNVYSYNPRRKEFQIIEYDYYAQSMLAQLQISEQDTEEQIQLKIKIIEEYNNRLDERIKRRQFVIEHRLLDTDFMIKTLKKYNKPKLQIFQPYRRLLEKNQDYFKVVEFHQRMLKASALSEGMIKVRRKLKSTQKNPQIKDMIDYLNRKKEKKQLLGKRARYQTEAQRKVLYKEATKPNKKLIVSMSQSSQSYAIGQSALQQANNLGQSQYLGATRTMTSRSQQRQRLKNQNQNSNRQMDSSGGQLSINQNLNFSNIRSITPHNGYNNPSMPGITAILSQDDINLIQNTFKKQEAANSPGILEFKPLNIKNFILKPLRIQNTQRN